MDILRALKFTSLILLLIFRPHPSKIVAESSPPVYRATLANGMQVVIVRDTLAPIVTVEENVLAGADESPEGFPGMAHAQEHMAFRGCAGMTADQTAAIYAQLGDENNANTQQNVTTFYATVAATDLDVALEAQARCLQDVDDSPTEWRSERGALEQEIDSDLSDPEYELLRRINQAIFAGTPYAQDGLGTRRSFDQTTGPMLKEFYRTWYVPSNVILVIVGAVDPARTLTTVTHLFGAIPNHQVPPRAAFRMSMFQSQSFSLEGDSPYVVGYIAYRLPGTDSPDYPAVRLLADVLGSQRAKLYGMTSAGGALQAGFEIEESYPRASVGMASIAVPRGSSPSEAVAKLRSIVNSYARGGVPGELIETARRNELAQKLFQLNSIPGLAETWSNAVATEGRSSPEDDFDAIRKVSRADVNRVAQQYLLNVPTVQAVLIPLRSHPVELRRQDHPAQVKPSTSVAPVQMPEWAAEQFAALQAPERDAPVSDTTLHNGIRLIVKTDHTSPTITLLGSVRHNSDLQTEAGHEGISNVLNALYEYGSQSLGRLAFQKALDDICAEEQAGYEFSLSIPRENFSRGVELLAENELDPDISPRTFAIARQQTIQFLRGDGQSVDYRAERALKLAMVPPNDPTLRSATQESLAKLTPEDMRAYQVATVRPDLTTMVIVGDISPEEARTVVERWFGRWKAVGPAPNTILPVVPLNKGSTVNVIDPTVQQDSVTLTEQLRLSPSDPDYYPLQLGTEVLDGGFYAARLYHELRQVTGYVYSVDVDLDISHSRAAYTITYDCSPANVARVRAVVERNLDRMRTEDVSSSELHQAKAMLLRQLRLKDASEESIAGGLLDRADSGLPLDEPYQAAKRYLGVTAEEVRTAFVRVIRMDDFVQVVRGPTPW